jgi:hypothetical protein
MNVMLLYPVMWLAACGLGLSVAANVMALTGMTIPLGKYVWGLHIGIFIVWLPTVLVAQRITRNSNRKDFWKIALSGCPVWMRRALYVLMGYAILNFVLFMITSAGQPKPTGEAPASVIRGFSGHWMIFYGVAFAVLYSATRAPNLMRERKCPQGHVVSPNARFCPECGYAFPDEQKKI